MTAEASVGEPGKTRLAAVYVFLFLKLADLLGVALIHELELSDLLVHGKKLIFEPFVFAL
jgi:hypothetical protein